MIDQFGFLLPSDGFRFRGFLLWNRLGLYSSHSSARAHLRAEVRGSGGGCFVGFQSRPVTIQGTCTKLNRVANSLGNIPGTT